MMSPQNAHVMPTNNFSGKVPKVINAFLLKSQLFCWEIRQRKSLVSICFVADNKNLTWPILFLFILELLLVFSLRNTLANRELLFYGIREIMSRNLTLNNINLTFQIIISKDSLKKSLKTLKTKSIVKNTYNWTRRYLEF